MEKRSFLSRNKGKIGKYGTIALNILFLVGISVSVIASKGAAAIFVPQTAAFLCPSFFSLFFQFIISVAPTKVEDAKNLFLQAVKDEDDKQTIEKAFSDVITEYESQRNSSRSEPTETASASNQNRDLNMNVNQNVNQNSFQVISPDNSPHEEIVRMNAYYNPNTNKLDITPRVSGRAPSVDVPSLPPLGLKNKGR